MTHRNEFSGRVFLGGLLSSSARLRFLCRPHPKLEIIRSPVFFSERQLFPSTSVSSRLAVHLYLAEFELGTGPGTRLRTLGTFIAPFFDSATPIVLPGALDNVPNRAPGSNVPLGSYPLVSITPVACQGNEKAPR